jgi:hypothetical protein
MIIKLIIKFIFYQYRGIEEGRLDGLKQGRIDGYQEGFILGSKEGREFSLTLSSLALSLIPFIKKDEIFNDLKTFELLKLIFSFPFCNSEDPNKEQMFNQLNGKIKLFLANRKSLRNQFTDQKEEKNFSF